MIASIVLCWIQLDCCILGLSNIIFVCHFCLHCRCICFLSFFLLFLIS
uniref:Uncharacterized protein n=1 Tax=Rhizophora mucronata TaxID=61149 RepID=A0A2P2N5E7_RHIMU